MDKKRKWWYEAFLDGYKPATLELITSQSYEQLKNYPHILIQVSFSDELAIFFQTEKLKKEYEQQIKGVKENSYEWHYVIGKMMGFPIKSVKWYAKMSDGTNDHKKKELEKYKIGVQWGGFFFATNLDFVADEVRWLWETYTHPKVIGYPLYFHVTEEKEYIVIPYNDFYRLNEFCEYIREKRGLVPTLTNK